MRYTMQNHEISVEIDSHGGEVKSVRKDGAEYLWSGDPAYWGRTSPVLFPFVGSVRDGKYRIGEREYPMGQHGFARDMEFTLTEQTDDSMVFSLSSNQETMENYPFAFTLQISYTIEGNLLRVGWRVINEDKTPMSFSIGAHPAFLCPQKGGVQSDYKLRFDTGKDITYYLLEGSVVDKTKTYTLPISDGYGEILPGMFDRDALIVEGQQAKIISLCYPDGRAYVTVTTDAPLFGLWSPAKKDAPFICIEPWYGRCDAVGFDGDLFEREYTNILAPGKVFEAEYTVQFD